MNDLLLFVRFDDKGEVVTVIWQPEQEVRPDSVDQIDLSLYDLFRGSQHYMIKKDPDGTVRLKNKDELKQYPPVYGLPVH